MKFLLPLLFSAACWGQMFPFPGPGNPVSAPSLPTVSIAASVDKTSTNTTQTITISAGASVGTGVIIAMTAPGVKTISSCTDNASTPNTYVVDQAGAAASTDMSMATCSAKITSAIAAGGTITATLGATTVGHFSVYLVSAFSAATWTDQNPTPYASGYSNAHTLTAGGAISGTNEVIFSFAGTQAPATTVGLTTGYTPLESNAQYSTAGRYFSTAYKVASSGTPAATATPGATSDLIIILTSYKTQ